MPYSLTSYTPNLLFSSALSGVRTPLRGISKELRSAIVGKYPYSNIQVPSTETLPAIRIPNEINRPYEPFASENPISPPKKMNRRFSHVLCCLYQLAPRVVAWPPRTSIAWPPGHLAPRPSSRATVMLRSRFFVPLCFRVCTSTYIFDMTTGKISQTTLQLFLLGEYCCGSFYLGWQ